MTFVHQPVAMDSEECPTQGIRNRIERQVDVKLSPLAVNQAQSFAGLDRPHFIEKQEDDVSLVARRNSARSGSFGDSDTSSGQSLSVQLLETLRHTLTIEMA
jgi:hypothetical protein